MTILPKKNKSSTTTCTNNSSSTAKNTTSTPSGTSTATDSNGNSPLANSDARKRPCTDRASNENIAHSSTSSDSNPGPSSSKRRHTTSTSSERRAHHHHHHLLHLHHTNLTGTSKSSTVTHQASPVSLTNYPETSIDVSENGNKVPSSTHSCCPSTCESTSQASSSATPSTGNSGIAIDTMIVTSEASNNQMPPPPASPTGYNSGDEYGSNRNNCNTRHCTPEQLSERERRFEKKLRKKGLCIMKMGEDGSCLFRAVADQVYGDEEMHSLVRKLCCDYMIKNSDYFSQYVTEDFTEYVSRKRRDHIQGNHVELQALSELFARPIEVYHYNSEPMNIFQSGQDDEDQLTLSNSDPIRVSYHTHAMSDSGHYNSVRPIRGKFKAQTALIYTPPQVLESAIRNSEADVLEKAMLEDKLRATDWEATNEALEEQVARESYLEWLRENERRRQRSASNGPGSGVGGVGGVGGRHSPLTTSSSTITHSSEPGSGSPKAGGSRSPNTYANESNTTTSCRQSWSSFDNSHVITCTDSTSSSSKSHQNSPVLPYYLEELPEGPEAEREILARVLLASRQEYLQSLKNCKKTTATSMSCNRETSPPPTAGTDA